MENTDDNFQALFAIREHYSPGQLTNISLIKNAHQLPRGTNEGVFGLGFTSRHISCIIYRNSSTIFIRYCTMLLIVVCHRLFILTDHHPIVCCMW